MTRAVSATDGGASRPSRHAGESPAPRRGERSGGGHRPRDGRGSDDGDGLLPRAVGTWRRAYAVVLGVLVADIVLLWFLARVYG